MSQDCRAELYYYRTKVIIQCHSTNEFIDCNRFK